MDAAVADAHEPSLSVRVTRQQPAGSLQQIVTYFIGSGFHIECDNRTDVVPLDEWPYFPLVNLVAEAGVFLFGVAGLSDGHRCAPGVAAGSATHRYNAIAPFQTPAQVPLLTFPAVPDYTPNRALPNVTQRQAGRPLAT
jgi:hypothetical protein